MDLRITEFSATYLPRVQNFECGVEDWCLFAERWIKSAPPFPGALQSMKDHGNAVWLYFMDTVDEDYLVGFSSLGIANWTIPPPDGPKREVGFIPMLAVALSFQGKPDCIEEGHYADVIMKHVIGQSRERGYQELCLSVHEDNVKAIHLYNRYGFKIIGKRDRRGILNMLSLLDR